MRTATLLQDLEAPGTSCRVVTGNKTFKVYVHVVEDKWVVVQSSHCYLHIKLLAANKNIFLQSNLINFLQN